jgi:tetratricopeptide (TPR) repeat protein
MQARFNPARDAISRARATAESLGVVLLASLLGTTAGSVELLAGDPVAAEQHLRPACDELEQIGELGFLASSAPLLAEALFLQGRHLDGLRLTERWDARRLTVTEDVDGQANWRRVRAKLQASRGEVEEAEHLAREATAMVAPTEFLDLRAQTLADLGEVLRLAGRPEESAAAVQEAIQLFTAKGNVAAVGHLSGTSVSVPE